MLLHIPTLMLALLLGFLLLTLALGVLPRGLRLRPEMRRWTQGSWAMLGGVAALAAGVALPVVPSALATALLSALLGHALVCLGLALYAQALYRLLCGHDGPRALLQVQPLIWLALLLMLDWPPGQRSALLALACSGLLLPGVLVILRHGWQAERALRAVALALVLALLALLVRALRTLLHPAEDGSPMPAGLGQGLGLLIAFGCLLGAGFGFVLAVVERTVRQMQDQATRDGLTGCWNRCTTDALLAHELQRSHRAGAPLAFVLLDLDHFKQINDRHGHHTGDAVLRAFASAVRRRLRSSDVFGRTGGEEFGLVLPATDVAGARWLVEAVRREVEASDLAHTDDGSAVKLTLSAGVAVADPQGRLSVDRLYGQADQSLYEAKRAGRNRVEVYGITAGASAALPLT